MSEEYNDDLLDDGGDTDESAAPPPKSKKKKVDSKPYYCYSEEGGLVCQLGSRETYLANFKPQVIEERIVMNSEDKPIRAENVVCCTWYNEDSGVHESVEVILTTKQLSGDHAIRTAFTEQLPRHFIIHSDWWGVWEAANAAAVNVKKVKRYTDTGWTQTDKGWGFILPGESGTITAEGLDEQTCHSGFAAGYPSRYYRYGAGVKPIESSEQRDRAKAALQDLFTMLPPQVLIPILDLVFGAPLRSLGLSVSPPLIHIHSTTGQYKTTAVLAAMGVFGNFYVNLEGGEKTVDVVPETWGSTLLGLQQGLHVLRDLPLLADDFKSLVTKPLEANKLVQNYADGTTRSRGGPDQSRRESLIPQALLISTGEERWEQEQSVQARMFSLDFPFWPDGSPGLNDRIRRIELIQEHTKNGNIQLVGGTYLRFLARQGREHVVKSIAQIRDEERHAITLKVHARIIDTLASLRIVERIMSLFFETEFPELSDDFLELRKKNWESLQIWLIEEAKTAEGLGPVRQVFDALHDSLASQKIRLNRRRSNTDFVGNIRVDLTAGYFDDEFIYLTLGTTWKWFVDVHSLRKSDLTFTWQSFCFAVKREFGSDVETSYQMTELLNLRALRIRHHCVNLIPTSPFSGTAESI
jgi:hypothetical protein